MSVSDSVDAADADSGGEFEAGAATTAPDAELLVEGVVRGDDDADDLTEAVGVAGALTDAQGEGDGTTIAPPTLNPSVAEFGVHTPLADLKLHGSVHGAACRKTGHVQVVPVEGLPHLIVVAPP